MPLGLLADRWNRNAVCAASGCCLAALSYLFGGVPLVGALTAGIGNALFHVGGGIDILNLSEKKAGALGIFVSPGAFGIFFGTLLGKQNLLLPALPALILLVAAVGILAVCHASRHSFLSGNAPVGFEGIGLSGASTGVLCLFLVVCLRSYAGMMMSFPWKSEGYWSILLLCAVAFGKAAGGLLADKAGFVRASVYSLGLCSVLFLLSANPAVGVAAVFLFNMTMPITLWAVVRIIPGAKGFSFGLLTFGLFLGFLPAYLGYEPLLYVSAGSALAAILSLILLTVGLKKGVRL